MEEKKPKIRRGRWNLVVLGISAVLIAATTTGIALAVYHSSGDIYLDRSRPGYLPDEQEIEDDNDDDLDYKLDKNGKIDMSILEQYLEELELETKAIDAYEKPFSQEALSNGQLGIPSE